MGILDRFRLDGKLALVTGSATGLGAAIAVALAEAGASVACHGNRRPAEETSEAIRALGYKSQSFAADLANRKARIGSMKRCLAAMGSPDIVVNNAGTIYREPAEDHDLQAWMTVVQVNLNSVFRLSQLAGRSMLERRQGKDHQHRVVVVVSRRHSCAGLCRIEGRGCAIDQGAGQRMGGAQCAGERHCSGLFSH